ncbi:TlpA family protein disulfide reductase [Flavobacterium sp.]|uniref:TlpA family protein disulfide reductase n=1 Tax=Flavobacterium sp. TaxID=239 RepID=UPI0022BC6AC2|nr:redoxin domain-containing protein [Flavobacterium sp.]MCZ8169238.1 redoxin domain-containing protein [Flavobacterium sp.]MCZ8296769.1 redoxin domain-containing protein [Flavobacterium sp.]
MKKLLRILIPLLFIGAFFYFGYQIYSKIQHKKEVAKHIKTIPKFEYQNIKGDNFTNKNLEEDTPTLFIYYNSECDYCNEETKMIKQNIGKLTEFQLCFISFEKPEQIKTFANKYQLNTYDNVHFLCDSKVTFATTFDVKSLPCLVLYDKNKKLIEKIKGQVKVETILKKLNAE